ncbi:MAG TPA: hypothetical protein VMH02_03085 [Verrucomicrobiae bacterium]|nr:hypothetical protein [Verrucomicrobiae bacterium]
MTESFRSTPPEQQWAGAGSTGNGYQGSQSPGNDPESGSEIGKALLVGVVGGLISAAGFLVYRRLPEEQKEKLHAQVRSAVQQRISELRQNFNI